MGGRWWRCLVVAGRAALPSRKRRDPSRSFALAQASRRRHIISPESACVFFFYFLARFCLAIRWWGVCVCRMRASHTYTHKSVEGGGGAGVGLASRVLLRVASGSLQDWLRSLTARCRLSDSCYLEFSRCGSDEGVPLRPVVDLPRWPKRGRRSGEALSAGCNGRRGRMGFLILVVSEYVLVAS